MATFLSPKMRLTANPRRAMIRKQTYPARPLKATLIVFVAISAFMSVFLPFDSRLRDHWPLVYLYGALLAISSVGLARLGRRAMRLLLISIAIAAIPAAIGFAIFFGNRASFESAAAWFQISLYLIYLVGALGVAMVALGWLLYFRAPNPE